MMSNFPPVCCGTALIMRPHPGPRPWLPTEIGRVRESAISSFRFFTGRSFLTTIGATPVLKAAIGTRSFDVSSGTFLSSTGACASWLCSVMSSVWPSAAERATYSAAIIPMAPGLFSTTTGAPPMLIFRNPASARAVASLDYPGDCSAISRMGLDGPPCARAMPGSHPMPTAPSPASSRRRCGFDHVGSSLVFILSPSWVRKKPAPGGRPALHAGVFPAGVVQRPGGHAPGGAISDADLVGPVDEVPDDAHRGDVDHLSAVLDGAQSLRQRRVVGLDHFACPRDLLRRRREDLLRNGHLRRVDGPFADHAEDHCAPAFFAECD